MQLRHCLPFAAFQLYRRLPLLQDAPRLVKQRRALRERNPPRNSQLETHRTDEARGGRAKAAPAYSPKSSSGEDFLTRRKTHAPHSCQRMAFVPAR